MTHPIIIAIDGPSASGKGTLARRLAEALGFDCLDTGLLYRAVGALAVRAGVALEDAGAVASFAEKLSVQDVLGLLDDPSLKGDQAAQAASKVAVVPAVRKALFDLQRHFATQSPKGGAVLDGRDIGTVIAPDAMVKIFVTASVEVRADRRWKELQARGEPATYASVLADLQARDARDANRATAPTKPAADAVILDTSTMTADQAFDEAFAIAEAKMTLARAAG